uniref:Uncharacterized protein n=1 Tax=Encephalitozoon cuniculi TaxID=6035 RepID=M1K797_ENCCN|nr:hypothetical protein ECU11_1300 [Encephalitozoon cuniculi]
MKNQRTILLLGSMTTGIIMVLFVADFMMPKRNSVKSAGLVERGRMSLFGTRTSMVGKYIEKKSVDKMNVLGEKMDALREKMDLMNKKLDRAIEIVRELKSSAKTDSAVVREGISGDKGIYHEPEYSYRYAERSPLGPRTLFTQPYRLGERVQTTEALSPPEPPGKSQPLSDSADIFYPKHSSDLHHKTSTSEGHNIPTTDRSSPSTGPEKKTEVESSLSKGVGLGTPGFSGNSSFDNTIGGVVSNGESLEKLIGEFLNESFSAIKPSTSVEEGNKEALDKGKSLREDKELKNEDTQPVPGGTGASASQKSQGSSEKKSAYARRDTQGSKEPLALALDKRPNEAVGKETSLLNSSPQKTGGPETKSFSGKRFRGVSGAGDLTGHSSSRPADGGIGGNSALYPSESEVSYDDTSSSTGEEGGAVVGLGNKAQRPRISLIKL